MAAQTLRDQAYQRFTRGLLAREIRAGQFVSQRELAELTGMSLGAIREMVPRLEADGLVRTVPQRGMQIAQVDVNLIRNAFQFRLIVEREAAAAFAQAAPVARKAVVRAAQRPTKAKVRSAKKDAMAGLLKKWARELSASPRIHPAFGGWRSTGRAVRR